MATKEQINASATQSLASKTLTAPVLLGGSFNSVVLANCTALADPVDGNGVATKQYVDAATGIAPGTVLTDCETAGPPTVDAQIANKLYVDTAIAAAVAAVGGSIQQGTPFETTLVYPSVVTQPHGLPSAPNYVKLIVERISSGSGIALGDRVYFNASFNRPNALFNIDVGNQIRVDAVNVTVATALNMFYVEPSTGLGSMMTPSNWKIVVIPYLIG